MAYIGVILELELSYTSALEAAKAYSEGMIDIVRVVNYEEGIEAARRMVKDGAVVIVTRGGYITHLRNADLPVPVMEIPFTLSTLTQTCMEASRRYGRIGIVGAQPIIEQAKPLERLLGNHVKYYWASSPSEYRAAAEMARRDGVQVMVGGFDETRYAGNYGIDRMVLQTGTDELAEALAEAMKIVSRIHAEESKREELNTLINIIGDALLSFNADGQVVQMNNRACKLLNTTASEQIGNRVVLPALNELVLSALKTGIEPPYEVLDCAENKYICTVRIFRINDAVGGAVAILQSVEYVQSLERGARSKLEERGLTAPHSFDKILGRSAQIQEAIRVAKRYSGVDSTVLITGESGTGKELFAQGIHNYSRRATGPFVAINCAVLPMSLLESELFGYSEGAFTGAKRGGKMGLFELAHNGTIFLDEVAEMELPIQARLLRVIEDKRVMRLGDDKMIPVNVRIVAATNKDLRQLVQEGKFREDLYYRLSVLGLRLPALRERENDMSFLLEHFIDRQAEKLREQPAVLSEEGMNFVKNYPWPGNVRELSNFAERLMVTMPGRTVGIEGLRSIMYHPFVLAQSQQSSSAGEAEPGAEHSEAEEIRRILEICKGNKSMAADILGVSRPTLYKKLKALEG